MAPTKVKAIHLFNCDDLCSLNEVEDLLKVVEKKLAFKTSFQIVKHKFSGGQISDMVHQTIPNLKMDYAVFVVHAGECYLSFSEDSGLGKIYEALKKRTGSDENVLILIGGDDNYKNKDEEDHSILSRRAKDAALSRQVRPEFIDGRKSFIFSWNKKHRPIHEEALLHYFDPTKRGQKFEHKPTAQLVSLEPKAEEPSPTSSVARNIQEETTKESEMSVQEQADKEDTTDGSAAERGGEESSDNSKNSSDLQVSDSHFSSEPCGSLMLETCLRYGKISFDSKDVVTRVGSWQPSERDEDDLQQKWESTPVATLKMFVDKNGELRNVVVKPRKGWCSIS